MLLSPANEWVRLLPGNSASSSASGAPVSYPARKTSHTDAVMTRYFVLYFPPPISVKTVSKTSFFFQCGSPLLADKPAHVYKHCSAHTLQARAANTRISEDLKKSYFRLALGLAEVPPALVWFSFPFGLSQVCERAKNRNSSTFLKLSSNKQLLTSLYTSVTTNYLRSHAGSERLAAGNMRKHMKAKNIILSHETKTELCCYG